MTVMYPALDGLEFLEYLWKRKLFVGLTCVAAVVLAGGISLALTPRYTATSSLLIETPGGNDPRASTAVSPVYLESLKTYELLASSNSLFERALQDLHIRERYPGSSIEALKRRILALNKPTNTTILEISATLEDPRLAQALAQYLAEHAVQLNARLDDQSNQDIAREPQRIYDEAASRLGRAEKASDEFTRGSKVTAISKEVAAAENLQQELETQLARARAELAEDLARQQSSTPGGTVEGESWRLEAVGAKARVQELETQAAQLGESLRQKEAEFESLNHSQVSLEAELKAARDDEESAKSKLDDAQANSALRGVRLKVLDPGIVPQRPSYPNTSLNLAIAALFSLVASVVFLAIRFAYLRIRRAHADPVYSLR